MANGFVVIFRAVSFDLTVFVLRCVALRCVALRCVALRCVALRCVALHSFLGCSADASDVSGRRVARVELGGQARHGKVRQVDGGIWFGVMHALCTCMLRSGVYCMGGCHEDLLVLYCGVAIYVRCMYDKTVQARCVCGSV